MHVRPTALLVGDENQALAAASVSLSPPQSLPVRLSIQTYTPPWYCTCPCPLVSDQVALYHVYEGLRNVR